MPLVSFEFFPPATSAGHQALASTAHRLAPFQPRFASVTYGAGGTTQDRTLDALRALSQHVDHPLAGHITTVGQTADAVHRVIDAYAELGVRHLVALRGDPPRGESASEPAATSGPSAPRYHTAVELVEGIRQRPDGHTFDISVSAYPEVHPKATSADADLENLKRKLDAGADRAISQFFFDPEVFLRFRDRAAAAGVDKPLVAGIMPVLRFSRVQGFADQCGATVPPELADAFTQSEGDAEVHQLVAATVANEQVSRLWSEGVEEFHFYTMNRAPLTAALCHRLSIIPTPNL